MPLKALVVADYYNLFDLELGAQQSQFAYLQAKDLADSVEGLLRTHDVSLWNGNDTSLSTPTTFQYMGAISQIEAGGNTATITTTASIVDGIKGVIAGMVANSSYEVRPTAIYANPVLLDLIDREMKAEFNVVLSAADITGGLRVKTSDHASWRAAAYSGVGVGLHRNAGKRHRCATLLHRQRRSYRVSLALGPESASFPVRIVGIFGFAIGGGEVRSCRS